MTSAANSGVKSPHPAAADASVDVVSDGAQPAKRPSSEVVESFARGLAVLEALSTASVPLTLAEVARRCETTRATARRLLLTLVDLDFAVEREDGFVLRPRVMDLGDCYLQALDLPRVAHPRLLELASTVQDTCSLTVLDGQDVVYVDRVKASRLMTVNIDVGTRVPAFATSTGRVLLAGLTPPQLDRYLDSLVAQPLTTMTTTSVAAIHAEVRAAGEQGFAVATQELHEALRSVAVPVRSTDGTVVAAVNVATHVSRTSLPALRASILPQLLTTARAIGDDLAEQTGGSSVA